MLALHLKSKGTYDAASEAKDLLLQVVSLLERRFSHPAAVLTCVPSFLQLLQRQEQDDCSNESIAETLDSLWDAWYLRNVAMQLDCALPFLRFVLGDLASAISALRRCIKFKVQVLCPKFPTAATETQVIDVVGSRFMSHSAQIYGDEHEAVLQVPSAQKIVKIVAHFDSGSQDLSSLAALLENSDDSTGQADSTAEAEKL
jgi:hypothetical protein